jgi:cell division protein FtsB
MTKIQSLSRYITLPGTYRNLPTGEKRFFLVICLVSFLVVVSWILFAPNGVMNYFSIQEKLQHVQMENRSLAAENKQLRTEIEKLKADPEYLEEIARKDYGLIKKNEKVFNFD